MPGRGLQQLGVRGRKHLPLVGRQHRAARHRLLGEQVPGAHQHPDPNPKPRKGFCHRRDHRRGSGVVHPASEQHLQLGTGTPRCQEAVQHLELRLPQGEARPRPDMPAAFRALEDEPPGPGGQELLEQPGRGHMQERVDAQLLKLGRLIRPAPGDQRYRRPQLPDHLELRGPHLRGREPKHANAPRPIPQHGTGLGEHRPGLRAGCQRQRQERQPAVRGDRLGERGLVAYPGHRALGDRQCRAELAGQVRARHEHCHRVRAQRVVDRRQHRAHRPDH
jgi:hypothetical protein